MLASVQWLLRVLFKEIRMAQEPRNPCSTPYSIIQHLYMPPFPKCWAWKCTDGARQMSNVNVWYKLPDLSYKSFWAVPRWPSCQPVSTGVNLRFHLASAVPSHAVSVESALDFQRRTLGNSSRSKWNGEKNGSVSFLFVIWILPRSIRIWEKTTCSNLQQESAAQEICFSPPTWWSHFDISTLK